MTTARPSLDRSAAAIGLLTVVAANFLYLAGLPRILDPMLSMEPFYIDMAHRPVSAILAGDPAWGPLYALWLKPLVAAFGDPLAVYAANLYGLSLGVSILIYLYVLLLTRRAAAAVGAALFFLISDLNVPLDSKVSSFALLVVLAGLTASEVVPAGARRTSVAAAGVLLASYARPELYPAALCLCAVALVLAVREAGESGRGVLLWPAAGLALIAIPGLWMGPPALARRSGDDRFFSAFREHFAWNWESWHGHGQTLFAIWKGEFGTAQTVFQAIQRNPDAVAHHLADNVLGTLRFLIMSAFDHYPLLAPATRPVLVRAESLLASAVALGILVAVAARRGWRREMLDRYGHVLVPWATVTAFAVGATTAIFPLPHYLVLPSVFLLLAATAAATVTLPSYSVSSRPGRVLAALACLAAVPKPFVLPTAYVVPGSAFKGRITVARTVADTIHFIRSLGLPAPVHVLAMTDGIGEMLGAGFEEVKIWQKGGQPLQAYLRDRHVDVIVSMEPGRSSFLVDDPYWELIQKTPEQTGFTRLAVPGHQIPRLWVRSDLLRKHKASNGNGGASLVR